MKFPKLISALVLSFFLSFLVPVTTFAAVGVTSSELQSSTDIILPSGSALGALDGYGSFALISKSNLTGGIKARYEARFSKDPWVDAELPELQIIALAYSSQDSALSTFNEILSGSYFSGSRTLVDSDSRNIFYKSDTSSASDVFGTINSEYLSYHLIHSNGNVLYQVSIFREDGEFNTENLQAYAGAIEDVSGVRDILENAVDDVKVGLGILFPPSYTDLSTKSEKSYLKLTGLYSVPVHGSVSFKLYIGERAGAVGTILDSSGIDSADEGDLYLYLNSAGELFAGIYAPDFDANCVQQSGWYRVETNSQVHEYEWNDITLHYGVGGFWISLNGKVEAKCSLAQPFSGNDLYFGDYPLDSLSESMIGYVDDLDFEYSMTDSGLVWQDVLEDQLFLDLPNTDPDVQAFQFLKEAGVFTGSDGMVYPDNNLNRAEMVKILLKAFDYDTTDGGSVPFWDVPGDAWYLKYLDKAYDIGMVEGNPDGSFAPGSELNHAEFYTMLWRISGASKVSYDDEFRDVDSDDWYVYGAAFALKNGLINSHYFAPVKIVTRRAAAKALYTLLK